MRETLKSRQDTSGDKFRIELDKQVLDNRGVAGELLLRRGEKVKTRFGEDIWYFLIADRDKNWGSVQSVNFILGRERSIRHLINLNDMNT